MTSLPSLLRSLSILGLTMLIACGSSETPPAGADNATPSDSGWVSDTEETLFPDPDDRTRFRLSMLGRLLETYYATQGQPPETLIELIDPSLAREVREGSVLDGWDNSIELKMEAGTIELRSRGPDGLLGTSDDLVYHWTPPS